MSPPGGGLMGKWVTDIFKEYEIAGGSGEGEKKDKEEVEEKEEKEEVEEKEEKVRRSW